jgi:hypothetical protein
MQLSQGSTVAIATKLPLLWLWLFAGSLPGAATPVVCVWAPHIDPTSSLPPSLPTAQIPLPRPTLFIREPLTEIRLERGDTLLWTTRAALASPLEGPLAWPLAPLHPRDVLTLRLRPRGAGPQQFATIRLQAAPPQRLNTGDALLRSLLAGPATAWRPAIEGLLARGDRALATALLFANEGPNEPALNALRLLAVRESCP